MTEAETLVDLRWQPLSVPMKESFNIAGGTQLSADSVLLQVQLGGAAEAESPIVGWGEAAPFAAVSGETREGTLAALADLRAGVVGRSVRDWRAIAREMARHAPTQAAARCGIEMALLDALGKLDGVPLWRSVGGAGEALTTDITITAGDVEHARDRARSYYTEGFRCFKVKVGALSPREDAERLHAICNETSDVRLVVDANGGYDLDGARQFLEGVRGLPLDLLEQPLPRGEEESWVQLEEYGVPLAADESARDSGDVMALAQLEGIDVINVKIMKSGIAEALSMISIARAMELELMIGGMVEGALAMTCSAQLAAGLGGFRFIDLDTPFFLESGSFQGAYEHDGGRLIWDREAPGIGVEPSPGVWLVEG